MNTALEESINADDAAEQANDIQAIGEWTRQLEEMIARVKEKEQAIGGKGAGAACGLRSSVRRVQAEPRQDDRAGP